MRLKLQWKSFSPDAYEIFYWWKAFQMWLLRQRIKKSSFWNAMLWYTRAEQKNSAATNVGAFFRRKRELEIRSRKHTGEKHAKIVQKVLKGVHWKHIRICIQVYTRSNVAFASGQAFKKVLFQNISWSSIQEAMNWPTDYSVPSNAIIDVVT